MKKVLPLMILGMLTLSMTSCVSTNKGFQSTPVIARAVQLDPIKADINVDMDQKLKGTSKSTYFLIFRIDGDNKMADGIDYSSDANAGIFASLNPFKALRSGRLSKVKGAAAFKALDRSDYDVLVHPSYTVTTKNFLIVQKYEIEVTGYGAKYENFRTEKQKVVITNNAKEYLFNDK